MPIIKSAKKAARQAEKRRSKNTAIKNAINASKDVNALLSLYMEHQQEVESNPEIKAMFTLRRQALQNQK